MLRQFKKYWWFACLALAAHSAGAFSMMGIREPYQVGQLSYIGDYSFTPKNLGEEFRWNIPTLYYTYDQAFYDYFGSNGVFAIDSAVSMLNGLSNVSSYSADLSEFPLASTRINWAASAMHLFDLKSCALENLVERLGLTDPERFTWTLRNRALPPGAQCPFFVYTVIKRNFDPVTWAPSSYVNGNLYTYQIIEGCPAVDQADAVELLVDPSADYSTAVATPKMSFAQTVFYGYFYNSLTRDDMGGLRYIYRSTNRNIENAGPGTFTFVTNNVPQLLVSSNLTLLAEAALTNDAPTLSALFPGLDIIGTTNFFTNVYTTNYSPYFTNYPWDPFGTPAHLAVVTNVTANVATLYQHSFGNLFTVVFGPNGWRLVPMVTTPMRGSGQVTIQSTTVSVTNSPYAPVGSTNISTNITAITYYTNIVMGDYVLLPTNFCAVSILYAQLTNVISYTNPLAFAVNPFANTNVIGTTLSLTQNIVNYFTNHIFVIRPVDCVQTNISLREGIEKVNFVRRDYDSLFNRFWNPVTNIYTAMAWTNNAPIPQTIERVVTVPDILFDAGDIVTDPTTWPIIIGTVSRQAPTYDTNGLAGPSVLGPGTIQPIQGGAPPGTPALPTFTYNKVGPIFENFGPFFIDEKTADLVFIWASFDGTTNAPIIYPIGTSITDLENQIFMQFTPLALADGAVGAYYTQGFSGTGGTPPYTFSLSPGSAGLPPGFDPPQSDGTFPSGVITGTPSTDGQFDFSIRMTDAAGRFVDHPYTLTITP